MEKELNQTNGLRKEKENVEKEKNEKEFGDFEERIEGSFEGVVLVENIEEEGDLILINVDADKFRWKKVTEQIFYPSMEEVEDILGEEDNFKIEVSNFK